MSARVQSIFTELISHSAMSSTCSTSPPTSNISTLFRSLPPLPHPTARLTIPPNQLPLCLGTRLEIMASKPDLNLPPRRNGGWLSRSVSSSSFTCTSAASSSSIGGRKLIHSQLATSPLIARSLVQSPATHTTSSTLSVSRHFPRRISYHSCYSTVRAADIPHLPIWPRWRAEPGHDGYSSAGEHLVCCQSGTTTGNKLDELARVRHNRPYARDVAGEWIFLMVDTSPVS